MFASAVAFLAFSVQPVLPYVDADSVGEALGMVALEIRIVDGVRQYCAQEVPSAKGVFDHYTLLWEKQDEDEILAVETILDRRSDRARFESMRDAALSSAMTVSRAAAAVVGAENYCGGFFEAIKSGNRNVAHQTPKASGFLKTYMRENPPVAEKVQWRNDFMGCKIKLSNNGTDLDTARKTCTCVTDTVHEKVSVDERAEIERVARAHGDMAQLPSMLRIAPDLAACAAVSQSP